jgi:hypothetical protein
MDTKSSVLVLPVVAAAAVWVWVQPVAPTAAVTIGTAQRAPVAEVCRRIQVTGSRVAIRDYPFTNGLVVRVLRRGAVLTSCERVRGGGANSYVKCGRSGRDWYRVDSGRLTVIGSPNGYVPATCVRVI